jgi:hypothetical protein
MARTVELVFFEGCPNVPAARANIRASLEGAGLRAEWTEWDLLAEEAPARVRGYASPTILVNGKDVTGAGPQNAALACRTGPTPSRAAIQSALEV